MWCWNVASRLTPIETSDTGEMSSSVKCMNSGSGCIRNSTSWLLHAQKSAEMFFFRIVART